MNALALQLRRWPSQQPILFLVVAAAIWFALYQSLIPASEALVAALPVDRASHLGGALQFFSCSAVPLFIGFLQADVLLMPSACSRCG